jgi:hypothetical protein
VYAAVGPGELSPAECNDWSVDLRERHVGGITSPTDEGGVPACDVGSLVRRLILFEDCTIQSNRLFEVPALVSVFGYEGVRTLFRYPHIRIICDACTTGQTGGVLGFQTPGVQPGQLDHFAFGVVRMQGRREYVSGALDNVENIPGLMKRETQKLKKDIAQRVEEYPEGFGKGAIVGLASDLRARAPALSRSIAMTFEREIGRELPAGLIFEAEQLAVEDEFRVVTNLSALTGIEAAQAHSVVERALLGVAGLNARVELMETYQALTGLQEPEAPLFEAKVDFIAQQVDPDAQERRFDRVVEIAGLPSLDDLENGVRIDVERLLAFREDRECQELRDWLRRIDNETDEEIADRFASVREELAAITHSRIGHAIRLIVTNGAGFVPGVGAVLGPGLTAADKLLFDQLIGSPGPVSFLGNRYPSLFESGPL